MRTKGSCRFEKYYKIEIWNDSALCWSPIQRSYSSIEEVEQNAPKEKYRVLEISEKEKRIV